MHIPRINVRRMYNGFGLKTLASKTKNAKEKAIQKIVPATMIVAESISGLNAHATTPIGRYEGAFEKFITPGVADWFKPAAKEAPVVYITPSTVKNLSPKNNFKKNSPCLTEEYKGTAEELNYFIDKLIPKRNGSKDYNPFFGKGEAFIKLGRKYNVNPTVLIAIGMHETGRGTSYAARELKNIGGIYINNKRAKFDNVEDCIDKMAEIISARIKANNKTIEDIGNSGKYCAKSASDIWVKNVMFFLNRM